VEAGVAAELVVADVEGVGEPGAVVCVGIGQPQVGEDAAQEHELPVYPILIRWHDALAEDVLDQAELAVTGRVADPARWPASVRVANAIELRVARLLGLLPADAVSRGEGAGRIARQVGLLPADAASHGERAAPAAGLAVPSVLVALAALHAAWALGLTWPAGSERALAEHVLSSGERERLDGAMPPAGLTWLVALGLAGAAGVVRGTARGMRSRWVRRSAWGVAGIFLARGLVFPPLDLANGLKDRYDRLDLAVYSPLCLALATGTALVLRRNARVQSGADANMRSLSIRMDTSRQGFGPDGDFSGGWRSRGARTRLMRAARWCGAACMGSRRIDVSAGGAGRGMVIGPTGSRPR
jgi:Protein of unknown function (DUF3995)